MREGGGSRGGGGGGGGQTARTGGGPERCPRRRYAHFAAVAAHGVLIAHPRNRTNGRFASSTVTAATAAATTRRYRGHVVTITVPAMTSSAALTVAVVLLLLLSQRLRVCGNPLGISPVTSAAADLRHYAPSADPNATAADSIARAEKARQNGNCLVPTRKRL
ncbi:Hypothetical protein CINCED_3A007944 [Cinara cedri]|uniref:Uncharacterized protein n=1 Tax=Cinara cedri TaxID=506608 RepID=A0A5E4MF53_9HEMI|nr:Hypothetical protein CINCED_3A007944 [Cinara cedri]